MTMTLYFHPLSSYCMKALVGLYELDVPFTKRVVDLMDEKDRASFLRIWPLGKFPVLVDEAKGVTIAESTIVLEYVDRDRLVPADRDAARECRFRDRFFDLYVNTTMGKIVTDKLRPAGKHDDVGVEEARKQLKTAYDIAETWAFDEKRFTLADCAAAPALFYANKVAPLDGHPKLAAYLERLASWRAFARVLDEAKPYFAMFPG